MSPRAAATPEPREARRATLINRRQTQIVDTAVALFAERGYHEVAVQDIAERAGISVGLIYRYAKSKQELLLLSLRQTHNLVQEALEESVADVEEPLERLRQAFHALCRVVDERRERILLHYADGGRIDDKGRREIRDSEMTNLQVFVELIEACIESGDLRPDVDAFLTAHNLKVIAHAWALKRWQFPDMSVQRYADEQLALFLDGVVPR